jgi:uncharacterized protein with PIN domain
MAEGTKFIVDQNAGKLAKWLRMMGYNTLFYSGHDDWDLIRTALAEGRTVLTRDTQIMKRRLVTTGRLKAILIASDEPEQQIKQVIETLKLDTSSRLFSICLECNRQLAPIGKEQVKERVPPYVFKTQEQYMECPFCHRIYWRGTHWRAMTKKVDRLKQGQQKEGL